MKSRVEAQALMKKVAKLVEEVGRTKVLTILLNQGLSLSLADKLVREEYYVKRLNKKTAKALAVLFESDQLKAS